YVFTIHNVETVVVPKHLTVHHGTVDDQPIALIINLHPESRVFQYNSLDLHPLTFSEINKAGSSSGRAVVLHRVIQDALVNLIDQIVRYLSTLTIDHSFARNPNILCPICIDQGSKGIFDVVIVDIGRAHQNGALVQLDGHVGFELDGASQISPYVKFQYATPLIVDTIDGFLDGSGIQGRSIGFDSKHRCFEILPNTNYRPHQHKKAQ